MRNDVNWGGCAILDPIDPTLWVVRKSTEDVQRFKLRDVIETGLRGMIVGLTDADRDAAIAECIADAIEQLRSESDQIARLTAQLQHLSTWNVRVHRGGKIHDIGQVQEMNAELARYAARAKFGITESDGGSDDSRVGIYPGEQFYVTLA